jgi:hypothetical protein
VQRLVPGQVPTDERRTLGAVTVHTFDVELLPTGLRASNRYEVGDRSWTQHWQADFVDDAELDTCAEAAQLRVERFADDERCWAVLRHERPL